MIVVLLIGSTGIYLPDYNMNGKPLESRFTLSKPTNDDAESCLVIFDGDICETQLLMKDVIFTMKLLKFKNNN